MSFRRNQIIRAHATGVFCFWAENIRHLFGELATELFKAGSNGVLTDLRLSQKGMLANIEMQHRNHLGMGFEESFAINRALRNAIQR